jgi:hypothetical protein
VESAYQLVIAPLLKLISGYDPWRLAFWLPHGIAQRARFALMIGFGAGVLVTDQRLERRTPCGGLADWIALTKYIAATITAQPRPIYQKRRWPETRQHTMIQGEKTLILLTFHGQPPKPQIGANFREKKPANALALRALSDLRDR